VSAGIVDNQVVGERSVPEPSSLLLLAVGLAALGARRRFSGK
jgi:hypothetical protein